MVFGSPTREKPQPHRFSLFAICAVEFGGD